MATLSIGGEGPRVTVSQRELGTIPSERKRLTEGPKFWWLKHVLAKVHRDTRSQTRSYARTAPASAVLKTFFFFENNAH